MTHTFLYQLLFLDPGAVLGTPSLFPDILRATLESRVRDLGLDPADTLAFLDHNTAAQLDHKAPLAVVYFGGPCRDPEMDRLVAQLVERTVFVLPLVASVENCHLLLPEPLRALNAQAPEPADTGLVRIATRLLEALHLERRRRQVFISYKRTESTGVARQLFHALYE